MTGLHASFAPRDRAAWACGACAPLVEGGALLDAVRCGLAERAGALLPAAEVLKITAPGLVRAVLPAGTGRVHLVSPYASIAGERRRLGAAISAISVNGVAIALDGPAIASGFHENEAGWRWTHGEGVLLLPLLDRPSVIEVVVAMVAGVEAQLA